MLTCQDDMQSRLTRLESVNSSLCTAIRRSSSIQEVHALIETLDIDEWSPPRVASTPGWLTMLLIVLMMLTVLAAVPSVFVPDCPSSSFGELLFMLVSLLAFASRVDCNCGGCGG